MQWGVSAVLLTVFVVLFLTMFVVFAEDFGSIDITQGGVQSINIETAPYGAAAGTIKFKLGNWTWYPQEVWLVPEGEPDDYRSMSKYYQISASAGSDPLLNKTNYCKTSLYNLTGKRAFKALQVGSDGSFCVLADPGRYRIYAK